MPAIFGSVSNEAGHLDATEFTPDILTRLTWRWGHLVAGYILTWGTSWCQKCHIITKISFAAALVKHTNNPIWCNFFFTIAMLIICYFSRSATFLIKW